jgi:hypothetical protein
MLITKKRSTAFREVAPPAPRTPAPRTVARRIAAEVASSQRGQSNRRKSQKAIAATLRQYLSAAGIDASPPQFERLVASIADGSIR